MISLKMCRICMSGDGTTIIFAISDTDIDSGSPIVQKLHALNLNLTRNDKLPDKICIKCIDELNLSFKFIEKSKNSEHIFRDYLNDSVFETFPATNRDVKLYSDDSPLTVVVQPTDDLFIDLKIVKPNEQTIRLDYKVKIEDNSDDSDQKHHSPREQTYTKVDHVVETQFNNARKLECKICSKTFVKHFLLNRHMLRHMKKGEKFVNQSITEKKSFGECPLCGMFFKTNYTYESHVKNYHIDVNVAGIAIEKNTGINAVVVKKADMQDPQIFICDYCYREFRKKRVLRRHILDMHNGPLKIIKCSDPNCKKLFKDTNYMMAHKFRHHDNKCCTICEKSFRRFEGLKTHIQSVHSKKRDHLCSLCGKSFSTRRGLNAHQNSHATEKRYSCDLCNNKYASRSAVTTHINSFHKGIKPYVCDFKDCTAKFNVPSLLRNHKRGHTGEKPYKCSFCPVSFKQLKHRVHHHRTHTGDRPFQCDYENCGSAFAQKTDLKSHFRIHTGEKPFQCHCGAAYRISSALKTHKKSHQDYVPVDTKPN